MKVSKFNNVYGETKAYKKFTGLKLSNTAPDSTLVKSNGKYMSCIWVSRGGGAFAIIPMTNPKNPKDLNIKIPDIFPLFRGHKDQVLDVDFDPFDQQRCVSCSNDSDIYVWDIPEDFSIYDNTDENPDFQEPVRILKDHTKKVLQVLYHPVAKDILASTSMDKTVKIWNVKTGEVIYSLDHPEWVTSISFNYNGKYLATCCKDKKLRIFSFEKEGTPELIKTFPTHPSPKNSKCCFIGMNEVMTVGFNGPERQFALWNVDEQEDESKPYTGFMNVDVSPSVMLPFADKSLNILLLAGKGDSTIKLYERLENGELNLLTDFTSNEPQKGFCISPRFSFNTDVHKNEIFRGYRTLNDKAVEEISFKCPLKTDKFQEDIYPDGPSFKPTLSADEWISHKSRGGLLPLVFSFKDLYEGNELSLSTASSVPSSTLNTPKPQKVVKTAKSSTPEPKTNLTETLKKEDKTPLSPTPAPKQRDLIKDDTKEDGSLKKDNKINKLLAKASSLDEINNAEDPSKNNSTGNDDEWDIIESNNDVSTPVKKQESTAAKTPVVKKEVETKTPEKKQTLRSPIKTEVKETSLKAEPQAVAKKPEVSTSKSTNEADTSRDDVASVAESVASSASATKTLSIKQSVEKLSGLVLDLTTIIQNLKEANLEKDERLKSLEAKVDELMKK